MFSDLLLKCLSWRSSILKIRLVLIFSQYFTGIQSGRGSGHVKALILDKKPCVFPEKSDGTIKQAIFGLKRPFLGSKWAV
jgi:hypothetical protein